MTPLGPLEGAWPADTSILDFWPQNWESLRFRRPVPCTL